MNLLTRLRTSKPFQYARRSVTIAAVILAAAVVSSLTIDLGPVVRARAEQAGSKQLKRQIHVGRLSIRVVRGAIQVDDFSIEGLRATDRPFFAAKRLYVWLDWATAFSGEITISSIEMSDWQMTVEKWEGHDSFPKLSNDEAPVETAKPSRITTTLRSLHASRGEFTYDDHEKPWSVVARNLDIRVTNVPSYHGVASFSGGTVKIQDHLPMSAAMRAEFAIRSDGIVHLDRIDLESDGARSVAHGDVDLKHWPEMTYQVKSHVEFARMREIFFTDETFRVSGVGDFTGTFHLFHGGHDLHGDFTSELAGVNDYRFPSAYGSLRWTPASFDVWNAGSRFYDGRSSYTYSIKPLGSQERPTARFDVTYTDVDLSALSDVEQLPGLALAGRATGRNLLEWPLGRFSEHRGDGHVTITPPPGADMMTPSLDKTIPAPRPGQQRPFVPIPLPRHLPVSGELVYRFDSRGIIMESSRFATERTHVSFQGSTEWGDRSQFAFHVTSRDWQESDQLLAGILTDFGSRTGPVAFGGRGEFEGSMTGAFRHPRVEGTFSGEDLRAWDTPWGAGSAHVVLQGSYADITNGVVRLGDSEIHADGRFSLEHPREDGAEEIDGRFRVVKRDLDSLRHAFELDDYRVSGLLSGEFHLTGEYAHPLGFGGMTIDRGTAYGEPFDTATASLRFDGSGVRLDGVTITKSGGAVTGAAFIGWDSTYSFSADGRRMSVERISALKYPRAPLSGIAEFTAGGSGTFDQPRYDVRFRVNDLFVAEEGVGQLTGSVAVRGKELSGQVEAASPRLAVTGTGRVSLTPQADSELTFRFHDTSLDPYVRLFEPRLSPFTTAIANGSIRVSGELADVDRLVVDGTVDSLDMRLFDYQLRNAAPIRLVLDRHQVKCDDLQLAGEGTRLRVSGIVGLHDERIAMRAAGEANLGILQGFFREIRSSGHAELTAAVDGALYDPRFSGSATISGGRIRHFSLPNSLDAVNGTVRFDAQGIRLDEISAELGGGHVQFGGRVGLAGYLPGDLNVTARGDNVHLRYPEGVRSTVDADLSLRGNFKAPALGGSVTVKSATWSRRIDTPGNIFDLAGRRSSGGASESEPGRVLPLRFDVQVLVPSTLRIENNLARMVASAELTLRGTYDHPSLFGHVDVDHGEVLFEGRRYRVTRGAINFTNPTRIEPFFDVEAETTVRVPGGPTVQGQTYHVTVSAAGTTDRLTPSFSSDPPLPTAEVLALLLSNVRRSQDAELRALANPNQTEADILQTRATQMLASPLSSEVGKVVEQTFGITTFQLSPSLVDPYGQQPGVSPSARLTIGKRISDRAYLTFSRSLNSATYDQIILLEYDQSDRLSWLLSRNEDATYALEFRVRHVF